VNSFGLAWSINGWWHDADKSAAEIPAFVNKLPLCSFALGELQSEEKLSLF
jgi:hypothetical protein